MLRIVSPLLALTLVGCGGIPDSQKPGVGYGYENGRFLSDDLHSTNSTPVSQRDIPVHRRGAALYEPGYRHVLGAVSDHDPEPLGTLRPQDINEVADAHAEYQSTLPRDVEAPAAPADKTEPTPAKPIVTASNQARMSEQLIDGVPISIWRRYCDPSQADPLSPEEMDLIDDKPVPVFLRDQCGFQHK